MKNKGDKAVRIKTPYEVATARPPKPIPPPPEATRDRIEFVVFKKADGQEYFLPLEEYLSKAVYPGEDVTQYSWAKGVPRGTKGDE